MTKQIDDETLNAVWCIDSETGRKLLMDRNTNKPIAEMIDDKIVEVQSDAR